MAFLAFAVLALSAAVVATGWWYSNKGTTPRGPGPATPNRALLDDSDLARLAQKAQLGDPKAQVELGISLRERNRAREDKQAFEWFTKAAERGDPQAGYYLGLHYTEGRGVLQDYAKAHELVQTQADRSMPEAQNLIGNFFRKGQGVAADRARAYVWYNLAAANGSSESLQWRDMMAAQLPPLELAEAQKQTRTLELRLKAGQGSGELGLRGPATKAPDPAHGGAPAANAPSATGSASSLAPDAKKP